MKRLFCNAWRKRQVDVAGTVVYFHPNGFSEDLSGRSYIYETLLKMHPGVVREEDMGISQEAETIPAPEVVSAPKESTPPKKTKPATAVPTGKASPTVPSKNPPADEKKEQVETKKPDKVMVADPKKEEKYVEKEEKIEEQTIPEPRSAPLPLSSSEEAEVSTPVVETVAEDVKKPDKKTPPKPPPPILKKRPTARVSKDQSGEEIPSPADEDNDSSKKSRKKKPGKK